MKTILYIWCEGESEKHYFDQLKKYLQISTRLVRIHISELGHQGSATQMLEKARSKTAFDVKEMDPIMQRMVQTWLVFDGEPHDPSKISRARAIYRKMGGHIDQDAELGATRTEFPIISWPSFDIWLILHKTPKVKGMNRPEKCKKWLKDSLGCAPNKIPFRKICDQVEPACQRAEVLWRPVTKMAFPISPTTSVHILVQHMRQLGKGT